MSTHCWVAIAISEPDIPQTYSGFLQTSVALQFSSRVAIQEEAVLLEVSSDLRFWGGFPTLLTRLRASLNAAGVEDVCTAHGQTAHEALALLRLMLANIAIPDRLPFDLPLHTLSVVRPHVATLACMGCNTWGDLQALPRGGVVRRFGALVLQALDQALGLVLYSCAWIVLPEKFDLSVELPALADSGPALVHSASRLLSALHAWLQSRQQGVLELDFSWRHELRRYEGVDLPATQCLPIRTAFPTQDMTHLRRLLTEHLERTQLAAPVNQIRLTVRQSTALPHQNAELLDEAKEKDEGTSWHELIERLGARLGPQSIQQLRVFDDHRPECMQRWEPATGDDRCTTTTEATQHGVDKRLFPNWLVRPARALTIQANVPWHHGPLNLLAGPQRLETGWWNEAEDEASGASMAVRDYFVAHNDTVGLVWIYRERLPAVDHESVRHRWFLQGIYG